MKKQKLGLNKLSLTKSRVATLNSKNVTGGNDVSTAPWCILTGEVDGCIISSNCPGSKDCDPSAGGGSNDPTCNTQAILSCLFSC